MKNLALLIGNLGNDAELINLESGKNVVKFSLATTEKWKDANGEKKELTQWHTCELWNNTKIAEYLKKGSTIAVEGKIKYSTYEKTFGDETVTLKNAVIVVSEINFLDKKGGHQEPSPEPAESKKSKKKNV